MQFAILSVPALSREEDMQPPSEPAMQPPMQARTTHTPDGQYEFEQSEMGLLGAGAHGVVRAARHVRTGEMVAVKVMPASVLSSVAKELIAQAKMSHPHIVQLHATHVDLDRGRVYMILELCRGGELFDRIAESGKLDEATARQYLTQAASAVAHCHALSVFHRDLKPENILLDENDCVKIADFGLAALAHQVQEDASFLQHTRCGSLMYAAPEVLASNAQNGYDAGKADVWSLGVILYSMLSGALPFRMAMPNKCPRFALVLQRGMRVLCEANGFSPESTDLLASMMEPDPDKRISAAEVLTSGWVTQSAPPLPMTAHVPATSKWCALHEVEVNAPAAEPEGTAASAAAQAASETATGASAEARGSKRGAPSGEAAEASVGSPKRARREDSGIIGVAGFRKEEGEGEEAIPDGVNGMLVRSLGWVQLPEDKEKMVGDVASALDSLGVKYAVVKGELSDVVWVGPDADTAEPAALNDAPVPVALADTSLGTTSDVPPSPLSLTRSSSSTTQGGVPRIPSAERYTQGQLCVRLRIEPEGDASSALHISRHAGDVLQFHSFYRDIRNQLSGANGWVNNRGRYEHVVPQTEQS